MLSLDNNTSDLIGLLSLIYDTAYLTRPDLISLLLMHWHEKHAHSCWCTDMNNMRSLSLSLVILLTWTTCSLSLVILLTWNNMLSFTCGTVDLNNTICLFLVILLTSTTCSLTCGNAAYSLSLTYMILLTWTTGFLSRLWSLVLLLTSPTLLVIWSGLSLSLVILLTWTIYSISLVILLSWTICSPLLVTLLALATCSLTRDTATTLLTWTTCPLSRLWSCWAEQHALSCFDTADQTNMLSYLWYCWPY